MYVLQIVPSLVPSYRHTYFIATNGLFPSQIQSHSARTEDPVQNFHRVQGRRLAALHPARPMHSLASEQTPIPGTLSRHIPQITTVSQMVRKTPWRHILFHKGQARGYGHFHGVRISDTGETREREPTLKRTQHPTRRTDVRCPRPINRCEGSSRHSGWQARIRAQRC